MPRITGNATIVDKQHSISFIDAYGRRHSQVIKTGGASPTRADALILAQKIADCSNATYEKVSATDSAQFDDSLIKTALLDEAAGNVENQIVMVFPHKADRRLDMRVVIPAYDASLLLADGQTVDIDNTEIQAVATAALLIFNNDGTVTPTGNYTSFRAFTTTRKVAGSRGRTPKYFLSSLREPEETDKPSELPGENPTV